MVADFPTPHSAIPLPFYNTMNDSLRALALQWGHDNSILVVPHEHESDFWWHIRRHRPPVIIVGAEQLLLSKRVIARADAAENRPIIVALVESADEGLLTECYQQGADRVLVMPLCSARIFRALLHKLLTRHDHYPPYLINASIQTFKFGESQVRLGKKPFDLARYLFLNCDEFVPKARILQDIWGLDSTLCITRRIEAHMSQLRRELALDGSFGWEIRGRRKLGYGIFKTT